jgi:hypothetical protein
MAGSGIPPKEIDYLPILHYNWEINKTVVGENNAYI